MEKKSALIQKRNRRRLLKLLVPVLSALGVVLAAAAVLLILNRQELLLSVDGEEEITVEYGTAFTAPKASAVCMNSLLPVRKQAEVTVDNPFDPEKLGDYTIRYRAQFRKLEAEKTVLVHLVDTEAPKITLLSDPEQKNGVNSAYKEEGYEAFDNYDGDLTEKVVRKEADGKVVYTVSDSSGNAAEAVREIVYSDLVPVITLAGGEEITLEVHTPYEEPGFTAEDEEDGDLTPVVSVSGTPDTAVIGDYMITYTVTDSQSQTGEAKRTVHVRDLTPPEIQLVVNSPYTRPGTHYEEEGYGAFDNYDGDLTASVEREEHEDKIIYRVSDSSGNSAETVREIIYKDAVPPVITLAGEMTCYLAVGTPYSEPGYSAVDDVDGDITGRVTVEGSVNSDAEGVYNITYSAADTEGNAASVTRQVYVFRPQQQAETVNPGSKVVYLTFDDGPGPYTDRLLAILDQYNVKATFFVTNQMPDYQHLIGEEARRGHTVAVHTFSHRYEIIYSSEEAYWNDFNAMNDIIAAQTGQRSDLFRFPGGLSNTVSKNYCPGIITRLAASADAMGLRYCDWNVSSLDAGGLTSAPEVAQQVINSIQGHDVSIVLQHDIWSYSVEAVPEIITWGLANGYTFLPMSASTPMVHQTILN